MNIGRKAIHQVTKIFGNLLDVMPEPFIALDYRGRLLYLNIQAEVLIGKTRDELIGNVLWTSIPEWAGSGIARELKKLSSESLPLEFEERLLSNDQWYLIQIHPSAEMVIINFKRLPFRINSGIYNPPAKAMLENIKESYLFQTINALMAITEKRDSYTAEHQQRVSKLAWMIASEMNLTQANKKGVLIAGRLHDIGKIYVPFDILYKPGPLNNMEMGICQFHTEVAYDILNKIAFDYPIATIVLQHHERLDGSGYPAGLTGKDILLEAKILSVADVVDAMASHRPYRPAVGFDEALREIECNKGKLYDHQVVDACLRLFSEKGANLAFARES